MSLLDSIKGMSVSKLRSKEEAQVAAAKVQRQEEASKPVSMMDEMRLRMQRRNSAISGKNARQQAKSDSLLFRPPPPMAPISEGDGKRPSVTRVFDQADSDSDRLSDVSSESEVSFDSYSKKSSIPPPVIPRTSQPAQDEQTKQPSPPPVPAGAPQRRGSLLDASNPKVASLLTTAQSKGADSDTDSGDDDWD